MRDFDTHKEKLISKRLGISALAMLISMLVLFAVIGIFQNANLALAKTAENTAAITADQSSNAKDDSATKNAENQAFTDFEEQAKQKVDEQTTESINEGVVLYFLVPIEQQEMGSLVIDSELPVGYGQLSLAVNSTYAVNGNIATFVEPENNITHYIAAVSYPGSIFTGWYDLDGKRITGSGTVTDTTIIYAMFSRSVTISGITGTSGSWEVGVYSLVSFYDETGYLLNSIYSDINGFYKIEVPINTSGRLIAIDAETNPRYFPGYCDITVHQSSLDAVNIQLQTPEEGQRLIWGYVYEGIPKNADTNYGAPIVGADVRLSVYTPEGEEINDTPLYTTTDKYGAYYFMAEQGKEYNVGVIAPYYKWDFEHIDKAESSTDYFAQNDVSLTKSDYNVTFDASDGTVYKLHAEDQLADIKMDIECDYTINLPSNQNITVNGNSVKFSELENINKAEPFTFLVQAIHPGKMFQNWILNDNIISEDKDYQINLGTNIMAVNYNAYCKLYGTVVDGDDGTQLGNISVYYQVDDVVVAQTKSAADGSFELNVDRYSSGHLWFVDERGVDPTYIPSHLTITTDQTAGASCSLGGVEMFKKTPPTPPPIYDKVAVFYVVDSSTSNPINNALVGIDINHGQRQQLARTNSNGLVLFDLPQNVNHITFVVLAEGYDLARGIINVGQDFPGTVIEKVSLDKKIDTKTLSFACPEHVSKYHVTYIAQFGGQISTYEADYSESFELYAYGDNYKYNINWFNRNLSIYDSSVAPGGFGIRYNVQLIPEKGYSVKDWDIQTLEFANGSITGNTVFLPILEGGGPGPTPEGARDFSLIGWEGHAGFTWAYYENNFPIDMGWNWAIDSYIYPYTYVWVDEDGSITATKHYEAEDWPYFGVAKTVVQTHPQEGYEFDYLTVNGQAIEKNSGFYVRDFDWGLFAVAHYKYSEQPDPPGPVPPGPVPPGPVPPGPVPPGPVPPDPPYPPDPPQPPVPPEPSPQPIDPEGGGTVIAPTSDYTWVIIAIIVAVIVLAGVGIGISQYLKRKKAKAAPKPPTTPGDGAKAAVGAAAKPKAKDEKKIEIPKGEAKPAPNPAEKPKEEKPKAEKPAEKPAAKPADKPKDDKPKHAK